MDEDQIDKLGDTTDNDNDNDEHTRTICLTGVSYQCGAHHLVEDGLWCGERSQREDAHSIDAVHDVPTVQPLGYLHGRSDRRGGQSMVIGVGVVTERDQSGDVGGGVGGIATGRGQCRTLDGSLVVVVVVVVVVVAIIVVIDVRLFPIHGSEIDVWRVGSFDFVDILRLLTEALVASVVIIAVVVVVVVVVRVQRG